MSGWMPVYKYDGSVVLIWVMVESTGSIVPCPCCIVVFSTQKVFNPSYQFCISSIRFCRFLIISLGSIWLCEASSSTTFLAMFLTVTDNLEVLTQPHDDLQNVSICRVDQPFSKRQPSKAPRSKFISVCQPRSRVLV